MSVILEDENRTRLVLMNSDGTLPREITPGEYDAVGPPAWNPDGTRIAFPQACPRTGVSPGSSSRARTERWSRRQGGSSDLGKGRSPGRPGVGSELVFVARDPECSHSDHSPCGSGTRCRTRSRCPLLGR